MNITKHQVSFGSTYEIKRKNGNTGNQNWPKLKKFADSLNNTETQQSGIGGNQSIKISVPQEKDAEIEKQLTDWKIVLTKKHDTHSIPTMEGLKEFFNGVKNTRILTNKRSSYLR